MHEAVEEGLELKHGRGGGEGEERRPPSTLPTYIRRPFQKSSTLFLMAACKSQSKKRIGLIKLNPSRQAIIITANTPL